MATSVPSSRYLVTPSPRHLDSLSNRLLPGTAPIKFRAATKRPGATGFDGSSDVVAACPGSGALVKPTGKHTIANTDLALAA